MYIAQQKSVEMNLPARASLKRLAKVSNAKPERNTGQAPESITAGLEEGASHVRFLREGQKRQKLVRARRRLIDKLPKHANESQDPPTT